MSATTDTADKPEGAHTPTGRPLSGSETLRRSVPLTMMKADGTPSSSAFVRSTHDLMVSTVRGSVDPENVAARWAGSSRLAGVWPIELSECASRDLPVYDDAQHPCACGGLGKQCDGPYPRDHASVDLRAVTRSKGERLARQLRDFAVGAGPLLEAPAPA